MSMFKPLPWVMRQALLRGDPGHAIRALLPHLQREAGVDVEQSTAERAGQGARGKRRGAGRRGRRGHTSPQQQRQPQRQPQWRQRQQQQQQQQRQPQWRQRRGRREQRNINAFDRLPRDAVLTQATVLSLFRALVGQGDVESLKHVFRVAQRATWHMEGRDTQRMLQMEREAWQLICAQHETGRLEEQEHARYQEEVRATGTLSGPFVSDDRTGFWDDIDRNISIDFDRLLLRSTAEDSSPWRSQQHEGAADAAATVNISAAAIVAETIDDRWRDDSARGDSRKSANGAAATSGAADHSSGSPPLTPIDFQRWWVLSAVDTMELSKQAGLVVLRAVGEQGDFAGAEFLAQTYLLPVAGRADTSKVWNQLFRAAALHGTTADFDRLYTAYMNAGIELTEYIAIQRTRLEARLGRQDEAVEFVMSDFSSVFGFNPNNRCYLAMMRQFAADGDISRLWMVWLKTHGFVFIPFLYEGLANATSLREAFDVFIGARSPPKPVLHGPLTAFLHKSVLDGQHDSEYDRFEPPTSASSSTWSDDAAQAAHDAHAEEHPLHEEVDEAGHGNEGDHEVDNYLLDVHHEVVDDVYGDGQDHGQGSDYSDGRDAHDRTTTQRRGLAEWPTCNVEAIVRNVPDGAPFVLGIPEAADRDRAASRESQSSPGMRARRGATGLWGTLSFFLERAAQEGDVEVAESVMDLLCLLQRVFDPKAAVLQHDSRAATSNHYPHRQHYQQQEPQPQQQQQREVLPWTLRNHLIKSSTLIEAWQSLGDAYMNASDRGERDRDAMAAYERFYRGRSRYRPRPNSALHKQMTGGVNTLPITSAVLNHAQVLARNDNTWRTLSDLLIFYMSMGMSISEADAETLRDCIVRCAERSLAKARDEQWWQLPDAAALMRRLNDEWRASRLDRTLLGSRSPTDPLPFSRWLSSSSSPSSPRGDGSEDRVLYPKLAR